MLFKRIEEEVRQALDEVMAVAHLEKGDIFVIGCSSSEVLGERIGKGSSMEVAEAIFNAVYPVLKEKGIFLAAQCCEHLNRAVVVEKAALLPYDEIVNAVPHAHAGGSFATVAYNNFEKAVLVESIQAAAGMDIGDTLIGMHLKKVAVPLRIATKSIGKAHLLCARTRPRFIGGERALYDNVLSGGDIKR